MYLLQTIEISLDHCEMWHFFKKHVNIFIIHKTTSPTAADTILMTASMPVQPYLVITVNERALEKTNDWDVITLKCVGQKAAAFGWTFGQLLLLVKKHNV